MGLVFRVFHLFRMFWIQNMCAFLLGGVICFSMFVVFEGSYGVFQTLQASRDAFFVQVFPDLSLINAGKEEQENQFSTSPLEALLASVRAHVPGVSFQISRMVPTEETNILGTGLSVSEMADLDIVLPSQFIIGKVQGPITPRLEQRLKGLERLKGVYRVNAATSVLGRIGDMQVAAYSVSALAAGVLVFLLFYLMQFVMSQLIVVRREEIQIEYLLGATRSYQKRPYGAFVTMFVLFSVSLAVVLWVFGVVPLLPHFESWVAGSGLEFGFRWHDPKLVAVFLGGFLIVVLGVFQLSWRYHFRRIIKMTGP